MYEKAFFKENESKWKNGEIQEHEHVTRQLQTLYITCLGGGSFCYIPFSLLRRPNNNTATNNNKNNTNTNNDNNNTNNNDNSNNNKDLFTSSIFTMVLCAIEKKL